MTAIVTTVCTKSVQKQLEVIVILNATSHLVQIVAIPALHVKEIPLPVKLVQKTEYSIPMA